jgi:lipase maturation factor 1
MAGVNADPRPLLVYDGECDFCRVWLERWRRATGDRVAYAPYQEAADLVPEIPRARFAEAIHLLESGGRWSRGAEAVFRSLSYAPGRGWALALYRHLPGFAPVAEALYRLIARHRPAALKLTRAVWGEHVVPPGDTLTITIFLRALGVVAAVAFLSLWVQIVGLIGAQGILPIGDLLDAVRRQSGSARFWYLPTLCWMNASDAFLHVQCALGTALGILLAFGCVPVLCLAGCLAFYLSLATACRDFLWFQWDGLLIEMLFLAIFVAPLRAVSRPATDPPPRRAGVWMLRWLLFRLMVASAAMKLSSGDPHWRDLTALRWHYETQCLPPWTAWFFHHLPLAFHRSSAVAMFVIEGLVPFLIVMPRRVRFAAAAAIASLQGLILVSGNYGFFNLLVLILLIPLLDDGVWPRAWRGEAVETSGSAWPAWIPRAVFVGMFVVSLVPLLGAFRAPLGPLAPVASFNRAIAPLRLVNRYGLFSVMTTTRNEIVIEGSDDGATWRAYEFRWKPGAVGRRPEFTTPHLPRLDWRMWFAALEGYGNEPWFISLCARLLEGSRPVLALLATNPFPGHPPRMVRAMLYEYHFSDAGTRRASGAWWVRTPRGVFCPALRIVNGTLEAVP